MRKCDEIKENEIEEQTRSSSISNLMAVYRFKKNEIESVHKASGFSDDRVILIFVCVPCLPLFALFLMDIYIYISFKKVFLFQ